MKHFLTAILFFLPLFCWAEPIADITKLAGRTKDDVAKVLGAPDAASRVKSGEKLHYAKGDIEIVFVAGKADWITVSAMSDVPFSPAALSALGLPASKPSFQNRNVIRWSSISGYLEVSIFSGQKNCDYAYVQVLTSIQ